MIVKSSNVGAIKIGAEARAGAAQRLRAPLRLRQADVARFPRREPGHCLGSVEADRQRAWRRWRWAIRSASRRCRWRRPSASVANGGELVQPRVVRAVIRDGARLPGAAQGHRASRSTHRHRGDADRDHGRRRRARHRQGGADCRLHRRRQDRHGEEAGQRQLLGTPTTTCRLSASCRRGSRCSRSSSWSIRRTGSRRTAASVAAPIFQKIAQTALRHYGVPPSINAPEPLLVARRER